MPEKTTEEIMDLVHAELDTVEVDDKQPNAAPIRVFVQDNDVAKSPYSWRVSVRPSREPRRWSYLYEELAIASENIADKTGVNVVFTALDPATSESIVA